MCIDNQCLMVENVMVFNVDVKLLFRNFVLKIVDHRAYVDHVSRLEFDKGEDDFCGEVD